MGKINIYQLKYFLGQFTRHLPKRYRKPFYLFGGVLGLVIWFTFLLNMTHSKYLYAVKDLVQEVSLFLWENVNHTFIIIFAVFLIVYIGMRYFRTPKWEEVKEGEKSTNLYNGSLYYQINTIISLFYIIFLVLAFLPYIFR